MDLLFALSSCDCAPMASDVLPWQGNSILFAKSSLQGPPSYVAHHDTCLFILGPREPPNARQNGGISSLIHGERQRSER